MADAWKVSGTQVPFDFATLYADARQRALGSRRLASYYDIILGGGYASDAGHLRWVIRGRVGEIEAWAKQIKEDSDG